MININPQIFIGILLGHLLGDFVLQNNWLALSKNHSSTRCLLHCLIYTLSVSLFTILNPIWAIIIFISHYPIDRYSLADKWLKLIKGRSIEEFLTQNKYSKIDSHKILSGGFTSIIYCVVDNTFHIILMVIGWCLLF
jgi:hypothetical protein